MGRIVKTVAVTNGSVLARGRSVLPRVRMSGVRGFKRGCLLVFHGSAGGDRPPFVIARASRTADILPRICSSVADLDTM